MRKALSFLALGSLVSLGALATKGKWTYYWICMEADESGSGAKDTVLGTCSGQKIATVTRHYAERVNVEGTGKLRDGRVINLSGCSCNPSKGNFNCFDVLDQ